MSNKSEYDQAVDTQGDNGENDLEDVRSSDEREEDHDGESTSVGVILQKSESEKSGSRTTYPGVLKQAGGEDEVVDGAKHRHDPQHNEDDISHNYAGIDFRTCFVEQLDNPIFWLLNVL